MRSALMHTACTKRCSGGSQGWQAVEHRLQLSGWSKMRRVVVLRRRIEQDIGLTRKGKG